MFRELKPLCLSQHRLTVFLYINPPLGLLASPPPPLLVTKYWLTLLLRSNWKSITLLRQVKILSYLVAYLTIMRFTPAWCCCHSLAVTISFIVGKVVKLRTNNRCVGNIVAEFQRPSRELFFEHLRRKRKWGISHRKAAAPWKSGR